MTGKVDQIRAAIRDIPDFPKPGIVFKDITPILRDPKLFKAAIDLFVDRHRSKHVDLVVVIDARGFLFGSAVAYQLGVGIVPVRKKGKLPHKTNIASYELEYGTNTVEMHIDAIEAGQRVLIVDDLLATGGTATAAAELVKRQGAIIEEINFLIELSFLNGRQKLNPVPVYAPIIF